MRKRLLGITAAVFLLAGGGAFAWVRLHPPPIPQPRADERALKDIPPDEYEQWMQDLGYTE